jgi:hypothetical protein
MLLGTGYFLNSYAKLNFEFSHVALLSTGFSIIALITIIVFLIGQTKEPDNQSLYTLSSVTMKFLMEMLLALVWFFVAKKTSLNYVLIFFVIYLTVTLFSIWVILKTLKNKSL